MTIFLLVLLLQLSNKTYLCKRSSRTC